MRQDEGGAAQRAAARVRRLREVQTAGEDHKVVRGDGNRPTDVPAGQTQSEPSQQSSLATPAQRRGKHINPLTL